MDFIEEVSLYSDDYCTSLLQSILDSDVQFEEYHKEGVDLNQVSIDTVPDSVIQDVNNAVYQYFAKPTLGKNSPMYSYSGVSILKVYSGSSVELHYDSEYNKEYRTNFVVLLYLNTVVAGQLFFPLQKRVILPVAGKLVIFPTFFTHPHQVFAPQNDRYALRFVYTIG